MSKSTTILLVKPQVVSVYTISKDQEVILTQSVPWTVESVASSVSQLESLTHETVSVLFAPEVSYLLTLHLPTDTKDVSAAIAQTLLVNVPEDVAQLDWSYHKIDQTEATIDVQVFAPVSTWWLPLKQALTEQQLKIERLLPLLSNQADEATALAVSLDQSFTLPKCDTLPTVSPTSEPPCPPAARRTLLLLVTISFLLAIGVSILVVLIVLV